MSDILLAEYTLKRALREHTMDLIQTSSPHLFCTPLPKHWRSNKSLPNQFRVVSLITIPDGTRVSVSAGNEDRPFAELKNPITVMHGNEARFSDLRFLGRSGRGKSFNITITVETSPPLVAVYARAIKVTVDGPRVPRNKYSTPRTMKLMKEHRRMSTRHVGSFDQGRFCRGSSGRSYGNDSIRNATKRNSAMSANNFKDKFTGRIPFSSPAFGIGSLPTSTGNTSRTCRSPLDTSDTLPLSILSNGLSVNEKSPSSGDSSLPPSFPNKSDPNVPFSPFESTYLLSSINEAYARLLSRQLQPNQPPVQHTIPNPTAATRTFPSSTTHSDTGPIPLLTSHDEDASMVHRTPYTGRMSKENALKVSEALRFSSVLQRPMPSSLAAPLFTQSGLINHGTGNVVSSSITRMTAQHAAMALLNGSRQAHPTVPERRTTPNSSHSFVPPTSAFPISAFNSSAIGFNRPPSECQPASTTLPIPPTFPNPYESNFYGILGAIFANWVQRGNDRKGANDRQEVNPLPQALYGRNTSSSVPRSDDFTDGASPVDLVARNEDKSRCSLKRPATTESVESGDSILSIEKLLEVSSNHSKDTITEEQRTVPTGKSVASIPNPLRLPIHPFSVPELAVLSNAFGKHLKDQSFRA